MQLLCRVCQGARCQPYPERYLREKARRFSDPKRWNSLKFICNKGRSYNQNIATIGSVFFSGFLPISDSDKVFPRGGPPPERAKRSKSNCAQRKPPRRVGLILAEQTRCKLLHWNLEGHRSIYVVMSIICNYTYTYIWYMYSNIIIVNSFQYIKQYRRKKRIFYGWAWYLSWR